MNIQEIAGKTPRYLSYIIRCWQERSVSAGREIMVWRFGLQNPRTHEQQGFATLEALLVSLQAELDDSQVDQGNVRSGGRES